MGETTDYSSNPLCATVTISGWFACGNTGKYLSYGVIGSYRVFSELMAYSQEAVHINAKFATLSSNSVSTLPLGNNSNSCLTDTNCKAENVIRPVLPTTSTGTWGWNACCVISGEQTDPFLHVTLNADVLIEVVILTPIDMTFATSM